MLFIFDGESAGSGNPDLDFRHHHSLHLVLIFDWHIFRPVYEALTTLLKNLLIYGRVSDRRNVIATALHIGHMGSPISKSTSACRSINSRFAEELTASEWEIHGLAVYDFGAGCPRRLNLPLHKARRILDIPLHALIDVARDPLSTGDVGKCGWNYGLYWSAILEDLAGAFGHDQRWVPGCWG
jgi:hypothetical protein